MVELFKLFHFTPFNKVTLLGYDLGGAIALSCCTHRTLSKCVDSIIAFHPTWTDSIDKLSPIAHPVLLIWVPVETFHLISAGNSMLKVIKDSQMCKVVIGAYSGDKASGLYDRYAAGIMEVVMQFMARTNKSGPEELAERNREGRGRILEEIISPSKETQEEVELG